MIDCTFEHGASANLRHATADAIVTDEDGRVLLTKRGPTLSESGKWALPGGYADRDERLSDTAWREVKEETGWLVKDLKLFVLIDNPNRPGDDRQNITAVFTASADRHLTTEYDTEEVSEIEWFSLDELPDSIAFDHGKVLDLFRSSMAGEQPDTLFV